MDFSEIFTKVINSPVANVIGFILSLCLVYVAVDFIRKGLKK